MVSPGGALCPGASRNPESGDLKKIWLKRIVD